MPTQPIGTEILTIRELSAYLKVTERTIYRLSAARKIPSFKVGGAWRYSKADIDLWIQKQSGPPATAAKSKEEGRSHVE